MPGHPFMKQCIFVLSLWHTLRFILKYLEKKGVPVHNRFVGVHFWIKQFWRCCILRIFGFFPIWFVGWRSVKIPWEVIGTTLNFCTQLKIVRFWIFPTFFNSSWLEGGGSVWPPYQGFQYALVWGFYQGICFCHFCAGGNSELPWSPQGVPRDPLCPVTCRGAERGQSVVTNRRSASS